jgi:hypothetical protein
VRLTPDIALRPDGIRSTSDAFRDEIEAILDDVLPRFVRPERLITIPASQITDSFEWWPLAERLAAVIGAPLLAEGVEGHRRSHARRADAPRSLPSPDQLGLDLADQYSHGDLAKFKQSLRGKAFIYLFYDGGQPPVEGPVLYYTQ